MIQSVDKPRIQLKAVNALTDDQRSRWSEIQQQNAALQSPYFRPEFTQALANVRSDVEVAVLEQNGKTVGFFPFQRTRWNFGKPVGGRLSDFHGVVIDSGVAMSAQDILTACDLNAWDFDHLIEPQQTSGDSPVQQFMSPYLDLTEGYEGWEEKKRQAKSRLLKTTARYVRKVEREVGPIRFEWNTIDDAVFETLLEWKSEQYRRTGLDDLFQFDWIVNLLQDIRQQDSPEFAGRLAAMYVDNRLIAVHFGMQSHHVLHSWFPAYCLEFSQYRPGTILMKELARMSDEHGVRHIDLGKGDEQYKQSLMSGFYMVGEGYWARPNFSNWCRQSYQASRSWVKNSPIGPLARTAVRAIRPIRNKLLSSD